MNTRNRIDATLATVVTMGTSALRDIPTASEACNREKNRCNIQERDSASHGASGICASTESENNRVASVQISQNYTRRTTRDNIDSPTKEQKRLETRSNNLLTFKVAI